MNAVADTTIKGCPQLMQVRLLVTPYAPFVGEQRTAQAGIHSVSNSTLFSAGHDLIQSQQSLN
jgi:hypothetical protein